MVRIGVKGKLYLLVLTVLIPLIMLQISTISSVYIEKLKNELEANEDYAKAIISSFSNYIEGLWLQEALIGSHFAPYPDLPADKVRRYLQDIQQNQSSFTSLTWLDPEGSVLASLKPELEGKSFADRHYVQKILKGESKVLSNLVIVSAEDEPAIVAAESIKRIDGSVCGILLGEVNMERLSAMLPGRKGSSESRYGFVDSSGMIVFRSDMTQIPYAERRIPEDSPSWKSLNGEVSRTVYSTEGSCREIYIQINHPIDIFGWDCFVSTSFSSVMAEHITRSKNDSTVLILVSAFSVLYTIVLGKKIMKPIANINETVSAVRAGDYSVRTNIHGTDELAAAAESLDSMIESISKNDSIKSQFFTNMSHELKTPLNVIFASTQLIEAIHPEDSGCKDHARIRQQVRHIKQNCYRLIRIINNLIDVTRYDNGFLPVRMGNYNIVSIVEDIIMSVVKFAESKGISIIFDTDTEEKYMACDPDIIERIMLNLFSNALKFTDRGGSISVIVTDGGDSVSIRVKDTGVGIPEDKLNTIFERFRQVDSSLNRNQEGSGIGLSLVKSLVESHCGKITVKSETGKGTEFAIELPSIIVPGAAAPGQRDMREKGSQSLIDKINIEFSDVYNINEL